MILRLVSLMIPWGLDRAVFRPYMVVIEFSADDLACVVTRPANELSKTSIKLVTRISARLLYTH